MKRLASIAVCLLALVVINASAQVSLDATIKSLQNQIQIRELVDRDSKTSAALRILNRRVLETKRAELRVAVQLRIEELQSHLVRTDHPLENADRKNAEAWLRYLISVRNGARGSFNVVSNQASGSLTRTRIVGTNKTAGSLVRSASESSTRIILDPPHDGDSVIRGRAFFGLSEIAVQIRTRESADPGLRTVGALYSHVSKAGPPTDLVTYRVMRPAGFGNAPSDWSFTLKLSRPLLANQEVRALSASESTAWAGVREIGPTATSLAKSEATPRVATINQRKNTGASRGGSRSDDPLPVDPCEGKDPRRRIRVDWDTGKVFPSRLKHSGGYCIEVVGANTILYTYQINVEAESPSGNPFEILKTAIDAIKDGFAKTTPGDAGDPNIAAAVCNQAEELAALQPRINAVRETAATLEDALEKMKPKITNGKAESISLSDTITAFNVTRDPYKDFDAAATALDKALKDPDIPNCSPLLRKEAHDLFIKSRAVRTRYAALSERVNDPPPARVYDEFEETDRVTITVNEMYGHQPTSANAVTAKIAPGYPLISASAGALITKVPARSYSNQLAPDPANPTSTRTVLSMDNGGGTRPALTALLHYNLPFIQKRRVGLAISGGPVYDISGGKAETTKLGLFGGLSVRFSEWLYLTPGAHIGEFADFPEGLVPGQVVPSNIATPHPVKRYTTKFAFAMTFKVRDLGQTDNK